MNLTRLKQQLKHFFWRKKVKKMEKALSDLRVELSEILNTLNSLCLPKETAEKLMKEDIPAFKEKISEAESELKKYL